MALEANLVNIFREWPATIFVPAAHVQPCPLLTKSMRQDRLYSHESRGRVKVGPPDSQNLRLVICWVWGEHSRVLLVLCLKLFSQAFDSRLPYHSICRASHRCMMYLPGKSFEFCIRLPGYYRLTLLLFVHHGSFRL